MTRVFFATDVILFFSHAMTNNNEKQSRQIRQSFQWGPLSPNEWRQSLFFCSARASRVASTLSKRMDVATLLLTHLIRNGYGINCPRQSRFGRALIDNTRCALRFGCNQSARSVENEESADHVRAMAISRSCSSPLTFNQRVQFPVPNGREGQRIVTGIPQRGCEIYIYTKGGVFHVFLLHVFLFLFFERIVDEFFSNSFPFSRYLCDRTVNIASREHNSVSQFDDLSSVQQKSATRLKSIEFGVF